MVRTVNLRGINYLGSFRDKKGFCHFPNVTLEFRAFTLNLLTKLKRFDSNQFPRKYIESYAPAADGNDPDRYYEICVSLLRTVQMWYDRSMVELGTFTQDSVSNQFLEYLCSFYASALALYRCQQVVESGYQCPQFSEPIDFDLINEFGDEFFESFPYQFGYFWLFGSDYTNLISWIYYSRYTLSNKWLTIYFYPLDSSSQSPFKSQLDLYHNELNDIRGQLYVEVMSDEDLKVYSRHYGEQVRNFPISQLPETVQSYGFEIQEHPSASRVVTLHIVDHSDSDEVFPFPREAARP